MVVSLADYIDQIPEIPTIENETVSVKEPKEEPPFSCDHRIRLFILNQSYFLEAMGASPTVSQDEPGDCHPAYWASHVTKTNLLLIVIKTENRLYSSDCKKSPNTKPQPTTNSTDNRAPCHKLDLGNLHRRRLEGCYTYHDQVSQIESHISEALL